MRKCIKPIYRTGLAVSLDFFQALDEHFVVLGSDVRSEAFKEIEVLQRTG